MYLNVLFSSSAMLCTGILQLSGPSKRLLFRMHSCISIHRNSLHGPPASTAGSPTNVIRICEVKGNPLLKVASASSQTWRRRTVILKISLVSPDRTLR